MRLGMIGLGRMGTNIVRRLIKKHDCVVYDLHAEAIKTLQERYSNENKSPAAAPAQDRRRARDHSPESGGTTL